MKERQEHLKSAKQTRSFDLVVVGSGFSGVGIALKAAAQGLSVALLDENDFASGNSSKTNQLFGGNIPSIEHLEIKASRQICQERERLIRIAPHLLRETQFVLPLVRNNSFFNLKAALGAKLHDAMTLFAGQNSGHSYLNQKKLANMAPAIGSEQVLGGIQFTDAKFDDARLVLSLLKAAEQMGACLINYVKVSGFVMEGDNLKALRCRDRNSGESFELEAKCCINAGGNKWKELLNELSKEPAPTPEFTELSRQYIVLPASAYETNTGIFLPTDTGDFVFILPWFHVLLAGSINGVVKGTGTPESSDQIDYLLSVLNSYAVGPKLTKRDLKASYECREYSVLSPGSSLSKDFAIIKSNKSIYSVLGGKAGNYRLLAESLLQEVQAANPELAPRRKENSSEMMLGGWLNKEDFLLRTTAIETKARRLAIDPASIRHLISNYGAEAEHVVDLVEKKVELKERIIPDFPPILAEIPYSAISEMAISLQDFLLRRCRLALVEPRKTMESATNIADLMGSLLGWDKSRKKAELESLESELRRNDRETAPL